MDEALKQWLLETFIDIQGYKFGPYETSLCEATQVQEWACFGCTATSTTHWPTWGEPKMKHDADCKYVQLRKVLGLPAPETEHALAIER